MLWSVGICQRAILFIHSYTSFRCRWSVIQHCTTNIEMISLCYTFLSLRSCSLSLLLSLRFRCLLCQGSRHNSTVQHCFGKNRDISALCFFLQSVCRHSSHVLFVKFCCCLCSFLAILLPHISEFFLDNFHYNYFLGHLCLRHFWQISGFFVMIY